MSVETLTDDQRVRWAKSLMRLPKRRLADRLQETLEALDRISDDCAVCNVEAYRAVEAMDKRRGGNRARLERIQRHSLSGWGYAVGTMEVGREPLPGFGDPA